MDEMNKLTTNYNKTKSMIFTKKKHFNNCKVDIPNNHKIEQGGLTQMKKATGYCF